MQIRLGPLKNIVQKLSAGCKEVAANMNKYAGGDGSQDGVVGMSLVLGGYMLQ